MINQLLLEEVEEALEDVPQDGQGEEPRENSLPLPIIIILNPLLLLLGSPAISPARLLLIRSRCWVRAELALPQGLGRLVLLLLQLLVHLGDDAVVGHHGLVARVNLLRVDDVRVSLLHLTQGVVRLGSPEQGFRLGAICLREEKTREQENE